jgi:secondary thiamine-phosphate synthase enzyme
MTSPALAVGDDVAAQGFRFSTETLRLKTDARQELYNLTDRVNGAVRKSGVEEGFVIVSSLHTTLALFVNEWQEALLHDIKAMLNQVIVPGRGYRHDDPRYSDCDRQNAHAHLQATLLGHTLSLPIARRAMLLGQFQAIIAAELDGPRTRDLALQIVGR